MLPRYISRGGAIGIALSFAGVLGAAAQSAEVNPSQDMAMQALSDICAKDMPDVAKIQAMARRRWKTPQNLKGLDYWRIDTGGEGAYSLAVGKQDNGPDLHRLLCRQCRPRHAVHRAALQSLEIPGA